MGAQTFDALFRSLKKGALDPVYYLYGEEDVLKQEAIQALLEHALDAATRDFNLDQPDAGSLDAESLHALVQTPPMMASRRVVVLRNVDQLRKKSKVRDELLRYLDAPNPDTVLILVQSAGAEDTESDLASRATAVELDRLPPERVRRWVDRRAGQLGMTIEPAAADLLLAMIGADLGQAAQELEKLAGLSHGRTVSTEDLAVVAGVRPGETVPDLVAAIMGRDAARAARLVAPVLEQTGISGVRVVSALGTALIGTSIGRAELDAGTPPGRLPSILFHHIETARPAGLGSWRDTAARWAGWAERWSSQDLRYALKLTLETDVALKTSTVSDENGLLLDLVLRLGAVEAVA